MIFPANLPILSWKTKLIHNDSDGVKSFLNQTTKVSFYGIFELLPVWKTFLLLCDVKDHLHKTAQKRKINKKIQQSEAKQTNYEELIKVCVQKICTPFSWSRSKGMQEVF